MKRMFAKLKQMFEDIIPSVEVEEVAMAYHGGRLVPLCGVHELGGFESPDAYCHYRVVRWIGKGWHPTRIGDPFIKVKENVKESKTQQRKDKR